MYSLAGPLPKSPLPFFIVFLNLLMHFDFPSIYFGFLFESPLDRPIRSSKVLILEKFEILEIPRMNIFMTDPYSSTDCSTK